MSTPKIDGQQLDGEAREYVTVEVAGATLGVAIDRVHDVFVPTSLTGVPLAPPEIVGVLNLRGRVVTALSLRRLLNIEDAEAGANQTALGIEHQGESYGLLADSVGEVMKLSAETREPNPVHMDQRWVKLSQGVHRLDDKLLIILDVDATLSSAVLEQAA